jgi:GntR family transcriptional regulator
MNSRFPAPAPLSRTETLPGQLQSQILDLIRKAQLKTNDKLPTEKELSDRLGVGRSTLREAIAGLVHRGILSRKQGSGTYLRYLPIQVEESIERLFSVTENIRQVGASPTTRGISIKLIAADRMLADHLQIPEGEDCLRIRRYRYADDVFAAYCLDTVPARFLPKDIDASMLEGSLIKLLAENHHVVERAESAVRPIVLTQAEHPELKNALELCLQFREVYYDYEGTPICYAEDSYNSQLFSFRVTKIRSE